MPRHRAGPRCASALFHGPAFQVIREVLHCGEHTISARLATAGAMGWPAQWQLDPAALDGALQLLRLWGVAQDGRASLPTGIGRCRSWAPWPDHGEVGCTVQCRRDNAYRLSGDGNGRRHDCLLYTSDAADD